MPFGIEDYLTIGAGGISFLFIVWFMYFMVKDLKPLLTSLKETTETHSKIIENNSNAIKEVSRSNDNVANALTLLKQTIDTFGKTLDKIDGRAERMESDIIRITTKLDK